MHFLFERDFFSLSRVPSFLDYTLPTYVQSELEKNLLQNTPIPTLSNENFSQHVGKYFPSCMDRFPNSKKGRLLRR